MAPVLTHRSVPACSFHATAFTVDLLPRMAQCTVTLGLQMAGCIQPCCLAGLPLRRGNRVWLRRCLASVAMSAALDHFQALIQPELSKGPEGVLVMENGAYFTATLISSIGETLRIAYV